MTLIDRVRRTLKRYHLSSPSTRLVAAVSGGPDSTALVHVLRELDAAGELRLVGLAHLNHQLRDAAAGDERFVEALAADLKLPFDSEKIDVRSLARREHRSIEDAAHAARYAFFERVVSRRSAEAVAVGHTRDDQAETFLLRLVRGAGARGLSAMHPRSGVVVRPLLDCSRAEVRAFLQDRGITAVHDETNDDVGVPRNRVRAELLPLLTSRFNPRVTDVLADEAELVRADEEYLSGVAERWRADHVGSAAGVLRVEAAALSRLAPAIARRVLHALMTQAASGKLIAFHDVERAMAVVAGEVPRFDAPGHGVQRDGPFVVLSRRSGRSAGEPRPEPGSGAFSHPLPVPGEVAIPEIGHVVSAEVMACAPPGMPDRAAAVVPLALVAGGLTVRSRRPGDRLRPSTAGRRKLQDLFVDRKVPRTERDRIPIVVDANGRIVWVAGQAIDQEFRVSDPAQAVVVLRLKGVGGSF